MFGNVNIGLFPELQRVELWALRRQQNDGDIGRHEEARG